MVAHEGLYVLVFRHQNTCAMCEKKVKILKIGECITRLFNSGFQSPDDYCKRVTGSDLPIKMYFLPYEKIVSDIVIMV